MADYKRSKKTEKNLNKNYLLRKENYPNTILAMRRVMADYNDDEYKVKTSSGADKLRDSGVVFAESNLDGPCHPRGRTDHMGEWRHCPNVSDEYRKQVAKLIAARTFKFKPGDGGNDSGGRGPNNNNSSKKTQQQQ